MRIWVADGEEGLMRSESGEYRRVAPPGRALCMTGGRVPGVAVDACCCRTG